ncbi:MULTISPECIES: cobalamin biosynthesis protein [unclassified Sphingomonas]|uniref:cobalamin biosynthesis protein n=1 Tax=Novosphingobium rhizosphaerae TaxID=1551649 RepID=UPI0015C6C7F4
MIGHGIVAGFGFRGAATPAALRAALALAQQGHPPVTHLATAADKAAALAPLAQALGLPLLPIAPEQLAHCATPTQSPASLHARGIGSLAEAAALAGAGPHARLLSARHISPDRLATCALAESTER